jgi:hypothetical protein
MDLTKLKGARCRCRKHRAQHLGIHTYLEEGKMQAAAYWNNHQISKMFSGPKSFSEAISWAKKHLPEEKVCSMTEAERRRQRDLFGA